MAIDLVPAPIARQAQGSICVDPSSTDWEPSEAAGFLTKTIFRDERTGETTSLMRIEAGSYFPAHAHDMLEEIYVLEGDFYDDHRSYGPGQYCQRAIVAQHTAGSKGGCTVFLVYRA